MSKGREKKRRKKRENKGAPARGPVVPVDAGDDYEAHEKRSRAILGSDDLDMDRAIEVYCEHLRKNLKLPCEVTGMEDFRWEERYVFGYGDRREYEKLKKTRPSYRDRYELLEIGCDWDSEWLLFTEDIRARCRRIADGREFILGLAELKATDGVLPSWRLIDDYAVWLVNNR
jgi:hypothetical protein